MRYFLLGSEAPPVLLPEPMPDPVPVLPAPDPEPVLLPGVVGVLLLPGVLLGVELLPDVAPLLAPLGLVMPCSFRHLSRSAPTMPRHLLLSEAPVELLPAAGAEELLPLPDAPDELLPEAPVELLPDAGAEELLPVAPPEALPEALLSVAPALDPVDPDVPLAPVDPEVCAMETLAIAKSAAAVAVPTSLNITLSSLRRWMGLQREGTQSTCQLRIFNLPGTTFPCGLSPCTHEPSCR